MSGKRQDYISWDEYFMGVAILSGRRSKDPNTQVGCCIVSADNKILSMGYNGLPRGCSDDEFPWEREGVYKEEIRELSKDMNLPTWNKPSFACLASRFVYGETITEEKLHMVDQAEQFLMDLGFHQFRVRIHGTMARIEVPEEDILKIADNETRTKITEKFRTLGFSYVTLDLQGFRSGSMNETLGK